MKPTILMAALLVAASASAAPPDYPQTASLNNKPIAAETAVARRALEHAFGNEWTDYEKEGKKVDFSVGHADINGDGRPDLLAYVSDYGFGYCGSAGCSGYTILATPTGYKGEPIYIVNFHGKLMVLPTVHKGMHDLRCDDSHHIFKWNGKEYS